MKNRPSRTHSIAAAAIIGAAYAALTMLLAPFSYGPIQLRVSEVLCVMPFFIPGSSWGLFIGCAAANLLTGNIYDVIFGSLATLGAALLAAAAGRKSRSFKSCVFACAMPVLFNSLVVGAVITYAYNGMSIFRNFGAFALNAVYVGIGEAVVLFALGLPLMRYLPKQKFFRDYIDKINS